MNQSRLNGVIALLKLLAGIVGLPLVLIAIGAQAIPSSFSASGALDAITGPDRINTLLSVCGHLAWAGWAYFAIGLVIAIIRMATKGVVPFIRDTRAPQPSGITRLGWSQQAGLLAVIAIGFSAAAAPAAMAAAPAQVPAAVAAQDAGPSTSTHRVSGLQSRPAAQTQPTHRAAPVPAGEQQLRVYHPKTGEIPGDIAKRELGDASRADEIIELNKNRIQPDGQTLGKNPWPKTGWTLLLPADHRTTHAQTHTVTPGETLSKISQDYTGDADNYGQIFDKNKGTMQPTGHRITNPDVIWDGDHIIIPTALLSKNPAQAAPAPRAPEPGTDIGKLQPRAQKPVTPAEIPSVPSAPAQEPVAPPAAQTVPAPPDPAAEQALPAPTGQPVTPVPVDSVPAQTTPDEAPTAAEAPGEAAFEDDDSFRASPFQIAGGVGGVGAVAAFGIASLIAAKRRSKRAKLRRGQQLPIVPEEAAIVETQLRAAADPAAATYSDQAVRALCAHCGQTGQNLPELAFARLTGDDIAIYLSTPLLTGLPAPWEALGEDGSSWLMPFAGASELPDYAELKAATPAPWPSLVTAGIDDDGGQILVDLERTGALTVSGTPNQAGEVLRALAAELGNSAFVDHLQVTVVGTCAELPAALGNGVVIYQPTIGKLLQALSERAELDRDLMDDEGVTSLNAARPTGAAYDAQPPEIIILAHEPTAGQREQLDELITALPRVAIAAIAISDEPITDWALRHTSALGHDAMLEPLGLAVTAQHYTDEVYDGVLASLNALDLPARGIPVRELPIPTAEELDALDVVEPAIEDAAAIDRQLAAPFTPEPEPELLPTTEGIDEFISAQGTPRAVDTHAVDGLAIDLREPAPMRISLYGKVQFDGFPEIPDNMSNYRAQMTSLLAYIATNPGCTGSELQHAFWAESKTNSTDAGGKARKKAVWDGVNRARRWLGEDLGAAAGIKILTGRGKYTLAGVYTDHDDFKTFTCNGDFETAGDKNVRKALDLVRGRPFAHAGERYEWAEPLTQEMIAEIHSAALHLAALCMSEGRMKEAATAARSGLLADHDNRLQFALMEATRRFNAPEAKRMAELVRDTGGMDDQTEDLVYELIGATP